ncbi:Serine/threonine-protein kinase ssp1 [Diplonema papillatum]|nr:Serine/threonine-protein kinase ssp1 [Diplonema papillatum]
MFCPDSLDDNGLVSDFSDSSIQVLHKSDSLEVYTAYGVIALINEYGYVDSLGDGNFGHVCLFEDARKAYVAIKLISKKCSAQFRREVNALRKIDSVHVMKLKQVFDEPGCPQFILVLEYAQGEPLGKIDNSGDLTTPVWGMRELGEVARQCTDAVAAVHAVGVAHLDIRPDHFIRSRLGDIKLIDFGSAMVLGDRGDDTATFTRGTPFLLAPEAMVSERFPAVSLDLWALGVTFYALAAGYVPFGRGSTTEAQLYRVAPSQALSFPAALSGEDGNGYRDFVSRILHKELTKRLPLPEMLEHPYIRHGVADALESSEDLRSKEHIRDVFTNAYLISYNSFEDDFSLTRRHSLRNTQQVSFQLSTDFEFIDSSKSSQALLSPPSSDSASSFRKRSFTCSPVSPPHKPLVIHNLLFTEPMAPFTKAPDVVCPRRRCVSGSPSSFVSTRAPSLRKQCSDARDYFYNNSLVSIEQPSDIPPGLIHRVLICEHHYHVLDTMKKIVKAFVSDAASVHVDVCRTGGEAIACTKKARHRVIFLSTQLLDSSGLQVAQSIRRSEKVEGVKPVPIVGLGGLGGGKKLRARALSSGCFQTIVGHPVPLDVIQDMLRWRGIPVRSVSGARRMLTQSLGSQYFHDYVSASVKSPSSGDSSVSVEPPCFVRKAGLPSGRNGGVIFS